MSRFTAIDLTGLSAPGVVETLVYEDILQELKDDCIARMAEAGVDYDVQMLESDPVVKVLEVAAYRELLLRARVNDAARAIMLAYGQKKDLEHLGVYYGVTRQLIQEATLNSEAIYESDARLRGRIQLAPEALSTAGPEGAYVFHAMSVDPAIKSVTVYQSEPGSIQVLPLTNIGNGVPSETILKKIRQRLNEQGIRPLTDNVTVRSPILYPYVINVQLTVGDGPDPVVVKNAAIEAINAYLFKRHVVGIPIMRSGLTAAAHVPGVENVTVISPVVDVTPASDEFAYPSNITVTTT